MMKALILIAITAAAAANSFGQRRVTPTKIPSSVPVKPGTATTQKAPPVSGIAGSVEGRTYSNPHFGFNVEFPASWLIPGPDFEKVMRERGFDVRVANTSAMGPAYLQAFKRNVTHLLTAYRSMPGTPENAFVIIAAEDIKRFPQIKDAVDYVDAVRASYANARLPAGFKYSETDAEKLGATQFAFLDSSLGSEKRRMYVTVRNGSALIFVLAYTRAEDLAAFRRIMEEAAFDR